MNSKILLLGVFILIIGNSFVYSQQGRGAHGHANAGRKHINRPAKKIIVHQAHHPNKVVVYKSKYRPVKIVTYRPIWRPAYTYHRRWVFFPKYNLYWDNWRQGYYYLNGAAWVYTVSPPPTVININLANEKNYELREDEDDVDDIYSTNSNHNEQYKE